MPQYNSVRSFPITVNGRLMTVTVTYSATYENGGISQHALTIEPCELVGTPQLSEMMFDIGDWTKEQIEAARDAAGIGTNSIGRDAADLAIELFENAQGCVQPRISEVTPGGSVTATFERDGNGQGAAFVQLANGVTVTTLFDRPGEHPWSEQTTVTDQQGRIDNIDTLDDNNIRHIDYFDPANAQLWDHRLVEAGPDGRVIGDVRDYGNVFDHYLAFHDFPAAQLSQFDWTSALDFSAAAERAAFDYVGTNDGTPSFFSYETNYSAIYDFSASTFNVSSNGNVTRVDSGLGFDISGGSGQPVNFAVGITTPTDLFDFSFDWLDSLFSPVVLDLDGNGINITPRSDSTKYFDVDNDGFLEQTAWAGPGDAVLMVDINGDHRIDRAEEIAFARQTLDPNDTDLEALATVYDSNHNGLLDAGDAQWNSFFIQVGNGQFQALANTGITSIGLSTDHQAELLPDGSRIEGFGSFTRNGVNYSLADVGFSYNPQGFIRTENLVFDHNNVNFAKDIVYSNEDGTSDTYRDFSGGSQGSISFINTDASFAGFVGTGGNDAIATNTSRGITLSGLFGNDFLTGGNGNDILDGGLGIDKLRGGAGNDTIYFDSSDDQVNGDSGIDTGILTSSGAVTYILADHSFETFISNQGDDTIVANPSYGSYIDGRAGNDVLWGGGAGDVLVGGTGSDQIRAGEGDDLLNGGSHNDALYGDGGQDVLFGGDGDDTLDGGSGDDTLDGGAGADFMQGGYGNDIYSVDGADGVAENADQGTDEIKTALQAYALGTYVENLTFVGAGNFTGVGSAFANVIKGGSGDDTIDGGAGADTMQGGAGNDSYYLDDPGDTVTELAGEGADTVNASVSYALGSAVEYLVLLEGGGAINGAGNELANTVTGNSSDNSLSGFGGNDIIVGNGGNDSLFGGAGYDVLEGSAGNDLIVSGVRSDSYYHKRAR